MTGRELFSALAIACVLGGCCISPDAYSAPPKHLHKDQHRVTFTCITGRHEQDVGDFKAILDVINVKNLPECSPSTEPDYVIRISRAKKQDELRIRFELIDLMSGPYPQTLIDLSSTGKKIGDETEDKTIHRLIERDRGIYVAKIDGIHW